MKALRIFLFILIVIGVILLSTQKFWVTPLVNQILLWEGPEKEQASTKQQPAKKIAVLISISADKITEANFSGTVSKISGASLLAVKMQNYIDATVSEFRKEANADVPDMRTKFGADSPLANYEIDINSKYIKGEKTESIVTDVYSYTGGAHGGTVYKVITADQKSGKILTLSNVIKPDQHLAFTEFVKTELNNWKPEGSDTSPVFTDAVASLTFNSFDNWSLDDQNLNIYFDQYAIGPGALGATAFPIPISKINNFLQTF